MAFTVTYLVPNTAGPYTASTTQTYPNAADVMVDNVFVMFLDASRNVVAMVPVHLHPVIVRQ